MKPSNLEDVLNKICDALEKSIRGFRVTQASISQDNVMVFCFIYENEPEDVVYLLGSEWTKLKFFDCCNLLIEKIHRSVTEEEEKGKMVQ